jgi:hypothetical protein
MFSDLKKKRSQSPPKISLPEISPPEQIPKPKKSAVRGKRSREGYRQRSVWLPDDLMKRVRSKMLDTDDERDFSDLVAELLGTWVDEYPENESL